MYKTFTWSSDSSQGLNEFIKSVEEDGFEIINVSEGFKITKRILLFWKVGIVKVTIIAKSK